MVKLYGLCGNWPSGRLWALSFCRPPPSIKADYPFELQPPLLAVVSDNDQIPLQHDT